MWAPFWLLLVMTKSAMSYDKRVFDVTNLPVDTFIIKAGENKSLSCPGVSEHFIVQELQWLSLPRQVKLVQFMSDSTTFWVSQPNRVSLMSHTFALGFFPVLASDSGDYICLMNDRHKPDAVVRLIVQDVPDPPGRPLFISFTSRSVNLSWAASQDTHYSAITHYIIHTR